MMKAVRGSRVTYLAKDWAGTGGERGGRCRLLLFSLPQLHILHIAFFYSDFAKPPLSTVNGGHGSEYFVLVNSLQIVINTLIIKCTCQYNFQQVLLHIFFTGQRAWYALVHYSGWC